MTEADESLLHLLENFVEAINNNTQALEHVAQSNYVLAQSQAEELDNEPLQYIDGTPLNGGQ